jgi:phosphoribosylanthranilate isomerase
MWVKICGNTNPEDAARAAELGAAAIGIIFAASRRQVSLTRAAAIRAGLPSGVERIGVFDSQSADEIADAAERAGLTGVQLHHEFSERSLAVIRANLPETVEIIATLHWNVDESGVAEHAAGQLEKIAATGIVRRVLVDSKVNGLSGGTGRAFDWSAAQRVFRQAPKELKLILAGGLTPETVGEAIAELGPWGVDVSSGVESTVGRKDEARVAEFIRRAKSTQRG